MSNFIHKSFSIAGLLAFSPEHKYSKMPEVKPLDTKSLGNVSDVTLDTDKIPRDENKHALEFVKLKSVKHSFPRVNSNWIKISFQYDMLNINHRYDNI